jgi:hypothetical protein
MKNKKNNSADKSGLWFVGWNARAQRGSRVRVRMRGV